MQIEISRISQLYKTDQVTNHTAHKMLNQISRDIAELISQEHKKINFLRKVKRSMKTEITTEKS
ncbi:hypothetical protein ES705_47283 [subsurface metagenome]